MLLFLLVVVDSFWNEIGQLEGRCGQQHVFFNDTDTTASQFLRYCTFLIFLKKFTLKVAALFSLLILLGEKNHRYDFRYDLQ